MAINVKSMFLMSRAVRHHWRGGVQRQQGRLPDVHSCHRREVSRCGIRCNAVALGFIRTEHGMRELRDLQAMSVNVGKADIAQQQGPLCEPEEVARTALFLDSGEATFVSAAHLFVDSGFSSV